METSLRRPPLPPLFFFHFLPLSPSPRTRVRWFTPPLLPPPQFFLFLNGPRLRENPKGLFLFGRGPPGTFPFSPPFFSGALFGALLRQKSWIETAGGFFPSSFFFFCSFHRGNYSWPVDRKKVFFPPFSLSNPNESDSSYGGKLLLFFNSPFFLLLFFSFQVSLPSWSFSP